MTDTVVKHPAKFSSALFPAMSRAITPLVDTNNEDQATRRITVLDPFAGTGKIHKLRDLGPYETTGVEIEPEWANLTPYTMVGDALDLPFVDGSFDAIVTSPTYGNRFADKHNAKDNSVRRSYTHDLGHELHEHNSGGMKWGAEYKEFHRLAWKESRRVLRPHVRVKGRKKPTRFVLNIKDHIRGFERQYVAGWHVTELCKLGFELLYHEEVNTPGMKYGENSEQRLPVEMIYVFEYGSE